MQQICQALLGAERFYCDSLLSSRCAIAYLMARGISAATAKAFRIGYAGESYKALSSMLDASVGGRAGLLSVKGGIAYDRFVNRIMFPIRDAEGVLVGFAGRVIKESEDVFAKYVNSPETEVFKKGKILYALDKADSNYEELIVVEGFFDVLSMHQYGFSNAVGSMGTAITRSQLQLLKQKTRRVVFCFDGDFAGAQAAKASFNVVAPLLGDGFSVDYAFLPTGHDPNSLLEENGAAGMRQCLDERMDFYDAVFKLFSDGENLNIAEGRARVLALVKPIGKALKEKKTLCEVLQRSLRMDGEEVYEYMDADLSN
ncbi:toprim domain-containing protein [Comamonadaceae bacterium OH2310_COT-174]|nr:toprim domain-containing protein [Comamonadaceae bacterium OH2310_COT-174]